MSVTIFECQVTEFEILAEKENDEVCFAMLNNCLIINLMDSKKEKVLIQTEINKEDAIELAKLILFKYNNP